jgi:glyoxylase-like metal-dependent hydrolase (beta-lactamase superfamily II)
MLTVHELAPGLWRWVAPHPAWTSDRGGPGGWEQAVACVHHEAPDAVVLIDPLVPPAETAEAQRFWTALDRDLERTARPLAVLIANAYHGRSADAIRARYAQRRGTSVHVPVEVRTRVSCSATHEFETGAMLPGGVQAHGIAGLDSGETAFWIRAHRALVLADAVIGAGAGAVRVAPPSWAAEGERAAELYTKEFRASLGRLVDLDPVLLLPSHGEPVLEAGAAALARAVAAPAWGKD